MPIYEYKCDACGHQMEAFQKMSEQALKVCGECGETALRKLISAAAFKLTGTGWYETDFKDKAGKDASGKSAEGGSKGDSTEGKPAAKAESAKPEEGAKAASGDGKAGSQSGKQAEAATGASK